MELKNEIEKQRLHCLQILNSKFLHEGYSGCLTDRQVKLVLDAMVIVLQENSMGNYNERYTESDMNDFVKWYIESTGQYPDDYAALKQGLYLKQYEQSKNEQNG